MVEVIQTATGFEVVRSGADANVPITLTPPGGVRWQFTLCADGRIIVEELD